MGLLAFLSLSSSYIEILWFIATCIPTSAVLSFKAIIANTCERINTINARAVSQTLHSCTVINIDATVPPTVASKTLTSIVSNKILN